MKKLLIVDVGIIDPYINLAIEELLYNSYEENSLVLFLWQNNNSVVVGQNQSVYSQCNMDIIKANKINVVRRKSGGGAVYHDLGNLNYTFISNYHDSVISDNVNIIISSLNMLGINAVPTGRNDIMVSDKKISGNAFYRDDHKICHHGTILVDSDLSMMYDVLNVETDKWKDKGIDSARGRTINLKEINPDISVDKIKKCLYDILSVSYSVIETYHSFFDLIKNVDDINKIAMLYSSKSWIFEKKFNESLELRRKYSWGSLQIKLIIDNNSISDCLMFSDALETEIIQSINNVLKGIQFCSLSIKNAFNILYATRMTEAEKSIASDIELLLISKAAF